MGVTSIRLTNEVEAPLEKLAQKLDRSKNYLVNQALREFIRRQAMEEARWADTLGESGHPWPQAWKTTGAKMYPAPLVLKYSR